MRRHFLKLVDSLEREHRRVERETHRRFIKFRFPTSDPISRSDVEAAIARAYWFLWCPELDISEHFEKGRNHVLSEAYRVLQREYGQNVRIHAYNQVRSGINGGLRGLLNTLLRLTVAEFSRLRSRTLVENYWAKTDPASLVQDSQDYVTRYSQLIPHELKEKGAGFLHAQFREVLIEHPISMNKLRQEIRR